MIFTSLMSHQKKALNYLKTHNKAMLAMFLGSGKSLVALAYAEHIKAKRILITSDKNNVLNTWPDEVYRHTNFECWVRGKPQFDPANMSDQKTYCWIDNYDRMKSKKSQLMGLLMRFDLWIGDESAEFKDQRTDRHKAIQLMSSNIPHAVLLNGKLMTERLEDIYGQLILIGGRNKIGSSLTSFRRKYMQPEPQGYGWIPKRSALTQIQKATKDIVYWLPDDGTIRMPERKYHTVRVPLTKQQGRLDEDLKTEFEAVFRGTKVETKSAAALYQKRIQLCGGVLRGSDLDWVSVSTGKIEVVQKIVEDNRDAKIVIWHTYIPETEILRRTFKKMGQSVSVVDSPLKTDELLTFAKAPAPAVLLIRTSLCKGLNQLADADIAIFYSNPLSYARRAQAEGRTRRITSSNAITHYVDILTEGGADLSVHQLLMQKSSFSMTLANLRKFV